MKNISLMFTNGLYFYFIFSSMRSTQSTSTRESSEKQQVIKAVIITDVGGLKNTGICEIKIIPQTHTLPRNKSSPKGALEDRSVLQIKTSCKNTWKYPKFVLVNIHLEK